MNELIESSNIRWKQRFESFVKALNKLKNTINLEKNADNEELIRMASIKAFEFSFELGWKTIKDYLWYNGIQVNLPRETIKQAYSNEIILDGQAWINMLEERNLMVHTYNEDQAKQTEESIKNNYLKPLTNLKEFLEAKI